MYIDYNIIIFLNINWTIKTKTFSDIKLISVNQNYFEYNIFFNEYLLIIRYNNIKKKEDNCSIVLDDFSNVSRNWVSHYTMWVRFKFNNKLLYKKTNFQWIGYLYVLISKYIWIVTLIIYFTTYITVCWNNCCPKLAFYNVIICKFQYNLWFIKTKKPVFFCLYLRI